jgi:hypothetical protein
MKRASIIINMIIFQLLFHTITLAKKGYIFFYKPYTDSSETNLYQKTQLKFDFKTQYNNIKNANIKNDVNNAILHKDYRFVSISGVGYLYPGLEGGYVKDKKGGKQFVFLAHKNEKYVKKYKTKVIEGTSDAISMSLPPLQNIAYDYAYAYNKILLLKIAELKKGKDN